MSKFPISSYVKVINNNKNLESYGLIGQVINPEEYYEEGNNDMASKMLISDYAVAMCILDSDCNKRKYAFIAFPEDDIRETHTFQQSSEWGVFEGTVTIIETKE